MYWNIVLIISVSEICNLVYISPHNKFQHSNGCLPCWHHAFYFMVICLSFLEVVVRRSVLKAKWINFFLVYFRCEWFWKFWIFPFHRDASKIYFFRTIAGRWLWDETHRQSRLTHVQCCYCPVFSLNTWRWKWCLLI